MTSRRTRRWQHPRCVYQILKRHYARYTPEMVERVCGVPAEQFLDDRAGVGGELGPRAHGGAGVQRRLDAALASARSTSARARSSSCCSATSAGPAAASSRCAATRASRARPTSRRCSTCCPATSPMPRAGDATLVGLPRRHHGRKQKGFWHNADAYMISLLKEYWGEAATRGERLLLRLPAAASTATTAPTAP